MVSMMSLHQLKKEIQGIKETVKEKPLKVLLQTKAKDMTEAEIDRRIQEVPVNRFSTDVIVYVINRDMKGINEYLGTDFKTVADMPSDMREKMRERHNK